MSDTFVGVGPPGRRDLRGHTPEALHALLGPLGHPLFRSTQLFRWVHHEGVESFAQMTNLSKAFRSWLGENAWLSRLHEELRHESDDGSIKFVWRLHDDLKVESVYLPEERRKTLCVSSQVGCAMGCRFCVTGHGGFARNLSSAEIVNQVVQVQQDLGETELTNLVFMGMGEPLLNLDAVLDACTILQSQHGLNFSHRRITISTVGILPKLTELARRSPVNLAVSLHATTQEARAKLIPPGQTFPLDELMEALRAFPLPKGKVITIEYILIDGVNCDLDDARRLVRLLHALPSKVNLIPYNENPHTPEFRRPTDSAILAYQDLLRSKGIHTVVRLNRGKDVAAACGQLGGYRQGLKSLRDRP